MVLLVLHESEHLSSVNSGLRVRNWPESLHKPALASTALSQLVTLKLESNK